MKRKAKAAKPKKRKNSRAKGAQGERELAAFLTEHGFESRRGQQFRGGADSPDVIGLPGVHVECKRVERLQLYVALAQAAGDCGDDSVPAVFHRMNKRPWVVIMDARDWLELFKAWRARERGKEVWERLPAKLPAPEPERPSPAARAELDEWA
jgi:hypothetical protein